MFDYHRIAASLYVPAMHPKLQRALLGHAYPNARSLIACTEDSVADAQLDTALRNLAESLLALPGRERGPLRFVRPRNVQVLKQILAMPGIEHIHGFVIPKADQQSLPDYLKALGERPFAIMPTLETADAFDPGAMIALRQLLQRPGQQARCLALRIGGNDLLALLGMRRPRGISIYQTPLGTLIAQLVMCFKPAGFQLTGPVFDYLDGQELLSMEALQDRQMGLIGKTAIHPGQLATIESAFSPDPREVAAAQALVCSPASAVMCFDGAMLERAVHGQWARDLLDRQRLADGVAEGSDGEFASLSIVEPALEAGQCPELRH